MEVVGRTALKVTVIICARNEVQNLGYVLDHCRPYADELLVVDGHSTDGTRELAAQRGARIVLDNGRGKGDAIRVGIQEARGDVLVFIDADCSHNPHDIPALVAPILRGDADHVTASRMLGGSEELHGDFAKFVRCLGSDIITLGINYRYGVGLTDSQNGFRALRTSIARQLDLKEDITTIEQEMIIKTLALGGRMAEVPSREAERLSGTSCINVRKVAPRYVVSWLKNLATNPPPPRDKSLPWQRYQNDNPWWRHEAEDIVAESNVTPFRRRPGTPS